MADGFLRDAYDVAAGGTLVVNRFNGVDGSAERAAFAQTAREPVGGFAEIYSRVDGLSVVLVARRAAPGAAARPRRPAAPRAPREPAASLAATARVAAAALRTSPPTSVARAVAAAREPARKSCDVMILGAASSASPRWMGGSS